MCFCIFGWFELLNCNWMWICCYMLLSLFGFSGVIVFICFVLVFVIIVFGFVLIIGFFLGRDLGVVW